MQCPFVYATGKQCTGEIYRARADGGAVASFEGKRMEFYPDELGGLVGLLDAPAVPCKTRSAAGWLRGWTLRIMGCGGKSPTPNASRCAGRATTDAACDAGQNRIEFLSFGKGTKPLGDREKPFRLRTQHRRGWVPRHLLLIQAAGIAAAAQ